MQRHQIAQAEGLLLFLPSYGTQRLSITDPALKRWAMIFRPVLRTRSSY